jgi:hypothetical protein
VEEVTVVDVFVTGQRMLPRSRAHRWLFHSLVYASPRPRGETRGGDNPRQSTWNSKAGRVVAPRITLGAARNGGEKKFILQISEPEQKVLEFFFFKSLTASSNKKKVTRRVM